MFYLVLCFHPRILVSSLLQSVGIHLEWEANPSELLSSKRSRDRSEKRHCIHGNNVICPRNAFLSSSLHFCVEEHSPYLLEHLDLAPEHHGPFLWSFHLESQKHHLAQNLQGQESHLCPWVPCPRVSRGLLFGSYKKEHDTNVVFRHQ